MGAAVRPQRPLVQGGDGAAAASSGTGVQRCGRVQVMVLLDKLSRFLRCLKCFEWGAWSVRCQDIKMSKLSGLGCVARVIRCGFGVVTVRCQDVQISGVRCVANEVSGGFCLMSKRYQDV